MTHRFALVLAIATACSTSPSTSSGSQAATATIGGDTTTAPAPSEVYDADGVIVTFTNTVTCLDEYSPCTGDVHVKFVGPDGETLNVMEDSEYAVTAADVNGINIAGGTLDDVRLNATALGLSVDYLLDTANNYFTNTMTANAADKTLGQKIKCVLKALGLGGKLTVATFACSGCLATLMGAELGPPDWIAGILTCGTCLRMTGMSVEGLIDLIKKCSNNPAVATAEAL